MNTILVPLDGSDMSREILPYARFLAQIFAAKVHLFHAIADAPADDARHEAETFLQQDAQFFQQDGLDVEIEVTFQSPAVSIVETAARQNATLIAMTTHGYSGFRLWTMGSVTEEVLHITRTPVFVTRSGQQRGAEFTPQIRRILIPLDGSDFSRKALPVATMLATHTQAGLHLLRAVLPADELYEGLQPVKIPPAQYEMLLEQERNEAERYLSRTVSSIQDQGIPITTQVIIGSPEDTIIQEATQQQSDVVVMATHGYYGIERWLVGSVAIQVLHRTTIPLLLVHGKQ